MRLIDADKLKVDYIVPSTSTNTSCYRYVSKEQIDNAPTIDAVEVVRRKGCKHDGTRNCPYTLAKFGYTDMDFCSCGDRKDEAQTEREGE